ncbi:MAG: hypothetical protein ACTSRZ_18100 [Promethearchaeota archaeon]
MYKEIPAILMIPRSFELVVFIVCANLMYKKVKKSSQDAPGYILKKTFLNVFYCWSVLLVIDILTNLIAPLSFLENPEPGLYWGYTIEYPSLLIANIIRDFYAIFATFTNYFTFRSVKIIQYGDVLGLEKSKNKLIIAFYLSMIVIYTPLDVFTCEISADLDILVDPRWDLIFMPMMPIVVFLYLFTFLYSFIRVLIIYLKERNVVDEQSRKKLKIFLLGYLFLIMGLFYFGIRPFSKAIQKIPLLYFQIVGQTIWSIAPILFYNAVKVPPSEKDEK